MDRAYLVCMIVGIAIPLCTLVLGSVLDALDLGSMLDGVFDAADGALDGVDLDISIGGTSVSVLPSSLNSICAGLLLFGTVGRLTYHGGNLLFANIVAGVSGYLAAAAAQTLIKALKRVKAEPAAQDDLARRVAKTTNAIPPGGYGAVSIQSGGGTVGYPARAEDPGQAIAQDQLVWVLRFEGGTAIVVPGELPEEEPDRAEALAKQYEEGNQ